MVLNTLAVAPTTREIAALLRREGVTASDANTTLRLSRRGRPRRARRRRVARGGDTMTLKLGRGANVPNLAALIATMGREWATTSEIAARAGVHRRTADRILLDAPPRQVRSATRGGVRVWRLA